MSDTFALQRLEELTPLLSLEDIVALHEENYTEYDVPEGGMQSWNLYRDDDIAVARTFFEAGTIVPGHIHLEWEMILVFEGELLIETADGQKVLKPTEFIVLRPGQEHCAIANQDTWIIAISIPAAEGFPGGKE